MLRLTRLIGLLLSLGIFGLYIILAFFNPYTPNTLTLTVPLVLMMLVALVGAAAAFLARPYLMILTFVVASPIGLYMLGTPGLFRWIGLLDILYLGSAIAVWFEKRPAQVPGKPTAP